MQKWCQRLTEIINNIIDLDKLWRNRNFLLVLASTANDFLIFSIYNKCSVVPIGLSFLMFLKYIVIVILGSVSSI